MGDEAGNIEYRKVIKDAYLEIRHLKQKLALAEAAGHAPIAIVGAGCRFPGGVDSLTAYQKFLWSGQNAIQPLSPSRWPDADFYDAEPRKPGKTYARHAALIDDPDKFDPGFFNISPREAAGLDPQQRLLLEVTWEALENAGIPAQNLKGTHTGVFIGISTDDYQHLNGWQTEPEKVDIYSHLGTSRSLAAGRISYFLGLNGPAMQLDTACSSSLVGLHLACHSLRAEECGMAIVGASNLILSPLSSLGFASMHAFSPDGQCKTFDASADGYARGEGCGVVILKTLAQALADGDEVLSVIRGTGVNHDGASNGLTAPSGKAQEKVIRAALESADIQANQVHFVEAHGTGTSLGDPIEMNALGRVYSENRRAGDPLIVGSVKTNFGHLESAAGMAGLLKCILVLQQGSIPPHLNFKEPNPRIRWQEFGLKVPLSTIHWPDSIASESEEKRRVGLSSFGMSGTNAHLILEAPPAADPGPAAHAGPVRTLCLSAKSEDSLDRMVTRWQDFLKENPALNLDQAVFTANTRRAHFPQRLALVAADRDSLLTNLEAAQAQKRNMGWFRGKSGHSAIPQTAFLFSGQGTQYPGMGTDLYQHSSLFKSLIDECERILEPILGRRLTDILYPQNAQDESLIEQTVYAQPAIFALQYALGKLWENWGVEPQAMLGHSTGEYAAACLAGVFSLEDALRLIAHRGKIMQDFPVEGQMAVVYAPLEKVRDLVGAFPGQAGVAAINGPEIIVISGEQEAVLQILRRMDDLGIRGMNIKNKLAGHSVLLTPLVEEFRAVAASVSYSSPQKKLISTVTGREISEEIAQADYWCRHLVETVDFAGALSCLRVDGIEICLEIGAQPTLVSMGMENPGGDEMTWLPSLRPGQAAGETLSQTVGRLLTLGIALDWTAINGGVQFPPMAIPTYAFARESYWVPGLKVGEHYLGGGTSKQDSGNKPEEDWPAVFSLKWIGEKPEGNRTTQKASYCLVGEHPVAKDLGNWLQQQGNQVGYTSVSGQCDYVLYFGKEADSGNAAAEASRNCKDLVRLIQSLSKEKNPPRLVVFSQNAMPEKGKVGANSLETTPLAGIVKALSMEHPEMWGGLIDLPDDAEGLFPEIGREVQMEFREEAVALREEGRYVQRLERDEIQTTSDFKIDPQSSALISGGMGFIGRQVAVFLAENGCTDLVICGRSALSPADLLPFQKQLENAGARMTYLPADVSSEADVRRVFTTISKNHLPLKSIFHLAGTQSLSTIENLSEADWATTFAAKASGAWNLHRASLDLKLDHFVLFSSISSVWASAGHGPYAAANHFLDALIQYREASGLVAAGINWGGWKGGGMITQEADKQLANAGLIALSPAQNLAYLKKALSSDQSQLVVAGMDIERFSTLYQARGKRPLLSALSSASETHTNSTPEEVYRQAEGHFAASLAGLEESQQKQKVSEYLFAAFRKVLGFGEEKELLPEDNFLSLGVDSLMIMEIIKSMKWDFRMMIYPSEFFEHPVFKDLIAYFTTEIRQNGLPLVAPQPKVKAESNGHAVSASLKPEQHTTSPSVASAEKQKTAGPVFVFSTPRAGSTLFRTMLSGHPDLFSPPELHLLPFEDMAEREGAIGATYLGEGLQKSFIELLDLAPESASAFIQGMIDAKMPTQQVYALLNSLAGNRILVDKSPFFDLTAETLNRAKELFPQARFIHLVRHPYSVIESSVRMRVTRLMGQAESDPWQAAEEDWVRTNSLLESFMHDLEGGKGVQIRFEDLVRAPEKHMREVCSLIGLDFRREMINPYQGDRMTRGIHADSLPVGDPNLHNHTSIDPALGEKWKTIKLPGPLQQPSRDLMEGFGYELPDGEAAPRDSESDTFPLTFAQEGLWVARRLEEENAPYNMRLAYKISGSPDLEKLEESLSWLVKMHEALRTVFIPTEAGPFQQVLPEASARSLSDPLRKEDLSALPEPEREARALEILAEEAQKPFDLEGRGIARFGLITLDRDQFVLFICLHHIVSDAWSLGILCRDLAGIYEQLRKGETPQISTQKATFRDFARQQKQHAQTEVFQKRMADWVATLKGAPALLQLPWDHPRPQRVTFRGRTHAFALPSDLIQEAREVGAQAGASLFMTLLTVFGELIRRYSGQTDIVLGSPVSDRPGQEANDTVGLFVNNMVFRLDLSGDLDFQTLLQRIKKVAVAAFDRKDLPFIRLVQDLKGERALSHAPVYQVVFALQNAPYSPPTFHESVVESLEIERGISKFDLSVSIEPENGAWVGKIEYSTDLFEPETIARMASHYLNLLREAVKQPAEKMSRLDMLAVDEKHQLLEEWGTNFGNTKFEIPVHEQFREVVCARAHAPAVWEGGESITYGKLDQLANHLALKLKESGVGKGEFVSVLMSRSTGLIVSQLAVLKAGGAFCMVDPEYPASRIQYLLEDSGANLLITDRSLPEGIDFGGQVIKLGAVAAWQESERGPEVEMDTGDLAYMVYTSGSTGQPKGVEVEHASLLNLCQWHQEAFALTPQSRATCYAGVGFDASIWELWPYLLSGGCMYIIDDDTRTDVSALAGFLRENDISHCFLPTLICELLVESEAGKALNGICLLAGGDKLHDLNFAGLHLVNNYGPSECTVVATSIDLSQADYRENFPIGKPIANTQILILDEYLNLCPQGLEGDIYIAGKQLARGYHNRPELTRKAFLPHPFASGERMYVSGDRGRWLPDGNIEFLGRRDQQLKIRGVRIEASEIENVLNGHPQIRETVVQAVGAKAGGKYLFAWFVSDQNPVPTELRDWLQEKLPLFMIPAGFMQIDAIPLTANGKVNHQVLPLPHSGGEVHADAGKEELSPLEEKLVAIWKKVLAGSNGNSGFGVNDNFFQIGGHSLAATEIQTRIQREFGVSLNLADFFIYPTVRSLARHIESLGGSRLEGIPKLAEAAHYPLSSAQKRLFVIHSFKEALAAYNIPGVYEMAESVDVAALERAFADLLRRHEALRTTFRVVDGIPRQFIHAADNYPGELQFQDLRKAAAPDQELQEQIRLANLTEFDLATGPLMKAVLLQTGEARFVLLLTLQHIIADGYSMNILCNELVMLYRHHRDHTPIELPGLPIQYKDYSGWQNDLQLFEAEEYWLSRLTPLPEFLNLPRDFERETRNTFQGKKEFIALSEGLVHGIKDMASSRQTTVSNVFLTLFNVLLYNLTGQEDVAVGMAVANRNHRDVTGLIGFFVNTLVIRNRIDPQADFTDMLEQISVSVREAFQYQDYPFDLLVEKLKPERHGSFQPLFNVMYAYQNFSSVNQLSTLNPATGLEDVDFRPLTEFYNPESSRARFDMTFYVHELREGMEIGFEYNVGLFKADSIKRYLSIYEQFLTRLVSATTTI